jgi:hypothetical protein
MTLLKLYRERLDLLLVAAGIAALVWAFTGFFVG